MNRCAGTSLFSQKEARMSKTALVIGDGYMPVDAMTPLNALAPDLEVRFRSVDPDDRPKLEGIREFQGSPDAISSWLTDESVLVVHAAPVTRVLLEAHPHVRMVACLRGGPVNIDVAAARNLGVVVTNTPGKNAESVTDLTLVYIHSLLRGIGAAQNSVKERASLGETHLDSTFEGGKWIAREPRGLTVGLVGYGAIGRLVAREAVSVGMTVVAHDPYFLGDAGPVELVDLATLAARSDVMRIHAKYTPETHHIIDSNFVTTMKSGAVLINTAREGLVDEQALVDGLMSGRVAGIALDVCEPNGLWPALAAMPNVILTPHLGGATLQTQQRGLAMAIADIRLFLAGKPVAHLAS